MTHLRLGYGSRYVSAVLNFLNSKLVWGEYHSSLDIIVGNYFQRFYSRIRQAKNE